MAKHTKNKSKSKAGAPCKLDADRKQRLLAALQRGATYELAANYAGICYDTLNNWMKRGKEEKKGEFFQLFEDIKKVEGAAAVSWLDKIDKAADEGAWQAAAWKLERRYPHQYGRTVQEVTGKDGEPIQHNFVAIVPKEAKSIDEWVADNLETSSGSTD